MSFAPPSGPPPPSVPEGWKAQYDDRYKQWFFVNLITEKSQWEAPTAPASESQSYAPPSIPPPSYEDSGPGHPSALAAAGAGEKKALSSNNPYGQDQARAQEDTEGDARLAAQLQAEEDERARAQSSSASNSRGVNEDYYNSAAQSAGYSPAPQSQQPQQSKSRGLLGRLMGRTSSSSSSGYGRPPPPPPQQYAYGGYSPQPPIMGGYPQPGYGYPQGGYYGAPQQQPQRRPGMGTAGAAALGVGGGLLGGMLLADAVDDFGDHHDGYDQGYDDGGDFGGGDF